MSLKSPVVEITLQDIYDEVIDTKKHVMKTNGKVTLNKWIATTAISLAILAIGLRFI